MERFIELVRDGRIEGIQYYHNDKYPLFFVGDADLEYSNDGGAFDDEWQSDHLCAHIRRWLSGKRVAWKLDSKSLDVMDNTGNIEFWTEGSELDWHLAAAVWCAEREG